MRESTDRSPPLRIALLSLDTRGGIQPYVALARGLMGAGHSVRMLAPADFTPFLTEWGVPAAPLSGSVEEVLRRSRGVAERGSLATLLLGRREMGARLRTWTAEALEACAGCDLMLGGLGGMVVGLAVAERLEIPFLEAHLHPLGEPTADFPGMLLTGLPRWLGATARRWSHGLTHLALWMPMRGLIEEVRRELVGHRPPPDREHLPVLYGFSPEVVPRPEEWHRRREVTGYWTLPAPRSWSTPPELEAFLAAGPAPVCIGFGSMSSADPVATARLVREAVRRAGVRAVLLSGWGGLHDGGGEEVFVTDAVPHDWLYPRMAAVVHHGGAGTTSAGLRAGIPSVLVPFTMDQPFWAARVQALGVGPRPIPRRQLTVERLVEALRRAMTDPGMRARAAALGAQLRAEDGVARAVAVLQRVPPQTSTRSRPFSLAT